jgi:hypothetical protein
MIGYFEVNYSKKRSPEVWQILPEAFVYIQLRRDTMTTISLNIHAMNFNSSKVTG